MYYLHAGWSLVGSAPGGGGCGGCPCICAASATEGTTLFHSASRGTPRAPNMRNIERQPTACSSSGDSTRPSKLPAAADGRASSLGHIYMCGYKPWSNTDADGFLLLLPISVNSADIMGSVHAKMVCSKFELRIIYSGLSRS